MGRRTIVFVAILWTITVVSRVSRAAGQTSFAWPDTAVNWSRYTTIEECEAALERSRRQIDIRSRSGPWVDTIADYTGLDAARQQDRQKATTVDPGIPRMAQGCMTHFAATDSAPLDLFGRYAELYLAAEWTPKVQALLERVATTTPDRLAADIDTVVILLGQAVPTRYALAENMVQRYASRVTSRPERARLYQALAIEDAGEAAADTVRALRALRRLERFVADSLTAADSAAFWAGRHPDLSTWISDQYSYIRPRDLALLDSLRKSTAAYLALGRSTQVHPVTRKTPEGKDTAVVVSTWDWNTVMGEPVVPIQAGAWAGRNDTAPRPTRGRVSLAVFLDPAFCSGAWTCPLEMAALHRLTTRVPALEITVVTRGLNYYRWLTTTPAEEAEMTRQMLASYGIPAAVALTTRDYSKRPEPDGRRVERVTPDPNWVYYRDKIRARNIAVAGGDSSQVAVDDDPTSSGNQSLLVDDKGIIVLQLPVTADKVIGNYAEVLLGRAKRQTGAP